MYLFMPDLTTPEAEPTQAVATSTAAAPPPAPTILFTGSDVVDVRQGVVHPGRDVLVDAGRIRAIGPALKAPRGAVVVPARGRYLMPGLVDSHVHLDADRDLLLYVASGVTSVQSLGGNAGANRARAAAVAAGSIAGPHVVSCDQVIRGMTSPDEAEAAIDGAAGNGAECIKIYSPPDWTADAHREVIRRARERGLRIGGHLPRNLTLAEALGHGQQFVAHAEEFLYTHFFRFADRFDESRLGPAAVLTRQSGAIVSPTLVAYRRIVDQVGPAIQQLLQRPELAYVAPDTLDRWKPPQNRYRRRFTPEDGVRLAAAFAFQQKLVRAWADAGVTLALGTDASPDMPFVVAGFSALDELEELAKAGLTPGDTIRAGTMGSAALIGQADEIGTVEVGRRADLLLLERNPLESISNVRRRVGVMVNGRWMPEEWLQQRLAGSHGR
jgi:imidazolonepropionase-like amidohydrolase